MLKPVKSCCGISSLKTGTVIIANISIIATFFGLIRSILETSSASGEFGTRGMNNFNMYGVKPSGGNNAAMFGTICYIIAYAIHLVLSILMLFGAVNERAPLICIWIVYSVVALIVHNVLYIVSIVNIFSIGLVTAGVIALLILCASLSLAGYFILVVYGFYTSISNEFGVMIQENSGDFNMLINNPHHLQDESV